MAKWGIAQFFEQLWWRIYLKNKNPEAYILWKKKYWETFLKQIPEIAFPKTANSRILDAGCGPAGIFLILQNQNFIAIDPLFNYYKEKFPAYNSYYKPEDSFINSKIESFSSTDKFDLIFCLNAINHVEDIDKALTRLAELSNEKATLVISTDVHNYTFFKKIFRFFSFDVLHPYQGDSNYYEEKLKKAGFSIQRDFVKKREFFFTYIVFVCRKD
ncbi:MAG: methyltransferase domain-containing protein [Chitinophagaceae bacterium]|nr:MAG: methyltransferase domain-containing protein [Chitinophagaceae bacterium]